MQNVKIRLEDGREIVRPAGIGTGALFAETGSEEAGSPIVAALVNNELLSLDAKIESDCRIVPVRADSTAGALVYRRSLCFLLAMAARSLHPGRRLIAGMAIGTGFYHYFEDEKALDEDQVESFATLMRELVTRNLPINLERWPWDKACGYFELQAQPDTLALVRNLNDPLIPINECDGFRDLRVAPLVASTGILLAWELIPYHGGLLLRYPHRGMGTAIDAFVDSPILYRIAEDYRERGRILGVGSVGRLHNLRSEGMKEYIQIAEALQDRKIASIAEAVAGRRQRPRIVLIAGPTSSGKTTTAKKLSIQLKVLGLEPVPVELDNFFLDREQTPLDAEGKPDFESIRALDVEFLNDCLLRLFEGEEVMMPLFDFKSGSRKAQGQPLRLSGREILILEGIHGLNDALTPRIPHEDKFKLYVSALTQLNLDDHNRISTTDYRLLRRMVRDNLFRGHGSAATLAMWPSVQRGEREYIFPFQNSADEAFNSALDYELGVLKVFADPLLRMIKPTMPEYAEARRIQAFLDYILPIPAQHVPGDSILREFIGKSDFSY
jgi:uridine kinase